MRSKPRHNRLAFVDKLRTGLSQHLKGISGKLSVLCNDLFHSVSMSFWDTGILFTLRACMRFLLRFFNVIGDAFECHVEGEKAIVWIV